MLSILDLLAHLFIFLKSNKRKRAITRILFILSLIDTLITMIYIIILQNVENFYKQKNYDKSTKYAQILIGLDSSSVLLCFINLWFFTINSFVLIIPP